MLPAFSPSLSLVSQYGEGESVIDMEIFGQILEMDDEEDQEFSKSIVWNFFDQAETTFEDMDQAL